MASLRQFLKDDAGAVAIEYVMIAGLISVVVVAGARAIGVNIKSLFFDKLVNGFS